MTFEVRDGDVAYLGDLSFKPAGLPMAPLFNPFANIKKEVEKGVKNQSMAIGSNLDKARAALQAGDDRKAALNPVLYLNDYRIPCTGRFIGRLNHPDWAAFAPAGQLEAYNDALAAEIAKARASSQN
ncbi:hypothetical protein [Asticcacaulis sp. AC402]|uniref:hypothetical protein n=1 Tax=Asticcacaulis sp. AC402 TaxID=1282361 RepID=UPI0003C3F449|nr:hypothetical protein [Asticcacaulis sp. AC402]ESQ74817.1 hypothetical protein ABAC402_11740 [Asticcacaulis sp. AC402]